MEKDDKVDRSAIASQGGDARDRALSAHRKAEIARQGALARWSTAFPHARAEGEIEFAGRLVSCAVLDNKLRVLTQETFLTTLGRAGKAKGGQGSRQMMRVGGLPPFLAAGNLEPYISDELRIAATPIVYRTVRGNRAYGYDAKLLPMVCEVYLRARDAHLEALKDAQERRKKGENVEAKPILLPNQEPLVRTCDLLVRSMAREHIVALVDRATGYQEFAVRDEITKILEAYIAPHLMPFTLRFPDEFFRQVYRIHGWNYVVGNRKMPQYVGKFINKYVYDELPEGVSHKLKELNPVLESGWRATQLHRRLTDTGNTHLDRQVNTVITLMSVSDNADDFKAQFAKSKARTLPPAAEPKALKVDVPPGTTYELFPVLEKVG
jgi:hypothetical protein